MIDLIKAIFRLNPSIVTIVGDVAYDANGNEVQYDKGASQAYVDAHAYQTKRAAEYPSFAEQFDTLYHGGYDAWKATIDSVKAKYPKP
jgi:hypothetical protein